MSSPTLSTRCLHCLSQIHNVTFHVILVGSYAQILLQILNQNDSCAWDPLLEECGMQRSQIQGRYSWYFGGKSCVHRSGTLRVHWLLSPGMGHGEETTKITHMLDLPQDLLNTILTLLVVSSSGAIDWVSVSATCKSFRTVALQTNTLRVVNCQNVKQVGHCESLHHINGLLSRCVRAKNLEADYYLAKAILAGGTQLWKMILENDLTNSSIKCATSLPSSERRSIASSLITGSIADLPYILFSLEDKPDLHESYGRLHHFRLIKSLILHVDLTEFVILRYVVKDFMEFFVGYHKYSESDIYKAIINMCWFRFTRENNSTCKGTTQ